MTNSLTVVAKVFSDALIVLLQKCEKLFLMQKLLTFFQQKISMYLPYFKKYEFFNIPLAYNFISFEQLGLDI